VGGDGKNLPQRHRDTEKKKSVKNKAGNSRAVRASKSAKRKSAGRARAAR
jgi:hypothetical protein